MGKEKLWGFIGFDAGIQLPGSLPAKAGVKGFQYYWNDLGENGYRLRGIYLDFTIPKAIKFKGALEFFDEDNPPTNRGLQALKNITGLSGQIRLDILPIEFMVGAQLVIATQKLDDGRTRRFWMVYVQANLSTGILIGPNIAFYGLQGLIAERLQPNKKPGDHWYRDWYKQPPIGAYDVSKWGPVDEGFAFGLGVHVGTFADGGTLFNANALFTMAFPGPIVLFSGKANFLRSRKDTLDPSKEGIFNFLLLYDGREEEFLFNLELNYEQQKLLKVSGLMEIYFHLKDPGKWHFYLGQKPVPKRITAQLIEFLKANAYLMIDPKGLLFGFFVGFDKKWDFGPLGVRLACYIKGDVAIVWAPEFLDAAFEFKGEVALRIFWFEIGLLLLAKAGLQTPRPFLFDILAKVKLTLPFPIPSPEVTLHLRWANADPPPFKMPFLDLQIDQHEAVKSSETWKAQNSDTFTENYKLVPVDAVLNFVFEKRVGYWESADAHLGLPDPPAYLQKIGQNGENWFFDYRVEELTIAKKVKHPSTGENYWKDITSDFRGKATFATLENTSPEPQSTERFIIQIGSTNPLRHLRHTDTKAFPPSQAKIVGNNLCPELFDAIQRCWNPSPPNDPLWTIDSIDEQDFVMESTGAFYFGRKACSSTSNEESDHAIDTSCLLSVEGNRTSIRFKSGVGNVVLGLRAVKGVRVFLESFVTHREEVKPTQVVADRYTFKISSIDTTIESGSAHLVLEGDCVCIEKLCYTPVNALQHKAWSESTRSFWSRTIKKWESSKAIIFESDTEYKVNFGLKGRRWHEKASDKKDTQIEEQTFYFKTADRLDKVDAYVEGQVPGPTPQLHFRNDRVDVHFKPGCDYVQSIISDIGQKKGKATALELHLYSGAPKPKILFLDHAQGQYTKWTRLQEKIRTTQQCHEEAFQKVEKTSKSKQWTAGHLNEKLNLEPQQHYTAKLVQRDVHDDLYSFEFRTSAYFNLKEMISSSNQVILHDLGKQKNYLTGKVSNLSLSTSKIDTWKNLFAQLSLQAEIGHDLFKTINRQTEHQQFEQAAQLLAFPPKGKGKGTRCYHIKDANNFYGMLLQFEEPINWDRARMKAKLNITQKSKGLNIGEPSKDRFYTLRSADNTQCLLVWPGNYVTNDPSDDFVLLPDAGPVLNPDFIPLPPDDSVLVIGGIQYVYSLQLHLRYTRDFIHDLGWEGQQARIAQFYKKYPGQYPIHSIDEGRKSEDFVFTIQSTIQK
ncbi:MAG: hypothetical protein AAF242_00865 [Bacteroidota bacterium]